MKKGFIKTAASILGVTALLLFAGAADAKKEVGSEAPASVHRTKQGDICTENPHGGDNYVTFDCGSLGEKIIFSKIYSSGWRVVSTLLINRGWNQMILFIEEQ